MKYLIAFIALVAPLSAQEKRQIDVSFYCLKYVPGLETIHIPKAEALEAVRLSTANMTAPVKTTLVNDEAIFRQGPANTLLAGKVRIPAEISKALVVLVPNAPGAATPYHSLLIDHGDSFRLGTYRVVNFSPRSIRGAIGKSYIEAAVGKMADLELKGEAGAVQGVRFEFEKEGRWNRLTETRCAVRKDRRWLLCVYQEPGTGRMNLRSIPDRTNLINPIPVSDTGEANTVSSTN